MVTISVMFLSVGILMFSVLRIFGRRPGPAPCSRRRPLNGDGAKRPLLNSHAQVLHGPRGHLFHAVIVLHLRVHRPVDPDRLDDAQARQFIRIHTLGLTRSPNESGFDLKKLALKFPLNPLIEPLSEYVTPLGVRVIIVAWTAVMSVIFEAIILVRVAVIIIGQLAVRLVGFRFQAS